MTAWIIRAGANGEREQANLAEGVAGPAYPEIGDLASADTREKIRARVEAAYPNAPLGRVNNFSGQLWALRANIKPGDLIVMPLKTSKSKIAMGVCIAGYQYRSEEPDPTARHTVRVDWKQTDVPRAAIKSDLLQTLNGASTVFQASRNSAEARLRALLETGSDPGSANMPQVPATASQGAEEVEDESVLDPTPAPTLEAIRDRVRTHLIEHFKEHDLTELIAAILRVNGYVCDVSPPGPDGGIDIMCGRGLLGLDSPTLVVEVKSQDSPVNVQVIRSLNSALTDHSADHGLLVAWGGLNGPAKQEAAAKRLRLRVWEADDVIDKMFDAYDQLPDGLRQRIPLTKAWVLENEGD